MLKTIILSSPEERNAPAETTKILTTIFSKVNKSYHSETVGTLSRMTKDKRNKQIMLERTAQAELDDLRKTEYLKNK